MDRILQGVSKFQREIFPAQKSLFQQLAHGQSPSALLITCADSRIVPNLITQTDPGELFLCRNAGNMVPPYGELHGGVSATIEYALCVLNVRDIIVCGHTDCGAMKGLLNLDALAGMPTVKSWLSHGEVARQIVLQNHPGLGRDQTIHALIEQNVIAQLQNLRTHPSVAARLPRGHVSLHGWVYHIETGQVDIYDAARDRFVPSEDYRLSASMPDSVASVA